jgi:hypothetical protein
VSHAESACQLHLFVGPLVMTGLQPVVASRRCDRWCAKIGQIEMIAKSKYQALQPNKSAWTQATKCTAGALCGCN